MNRVEIRGGPDTYSVSVKLNGELLRGCTRFELVGDANEGKGFLTVRLTLLAKVDVDAEAEVEVSP